MRNSKHQQLALKSLDACIAAIEIYNKPDFKYREEAFSILMINAWELLLKARIVRENGGSLKSIEVLESRINKGGAVGKRKTAKLGRSGNPLTIGLTKAAEIVRQYRMDNIDQRCVENLGLLAEIRDTCVHLEHFGPGLGKRIQEIGAASLKNYMHAAQQWFGFDLSRYNFFLMPLAFHSPMSIVESLATNQKRSVQNLSKLIDNVQKQYPSDESKAFNVTLQIELRFARTAEKNTIAVQVSKDPSATKIQISEEDVRRAYPLSHKELLSKLRERYSDFLANRKFYRALAALEDEERFCRIRLLYPNNPQGPKTKFYNANIIPEFDKFYARRSARSSN